MLRIRTAQLEALEAESRRALRERVLRALAAARPADVARLGEAEARRWIQAAEAAVDAHGGSLPEDLSRHVALMLDHGPRFDEEHGWAAEVFADEDIPPQSKLDVVEIYAREQRATKGGS